MSLGLLVEYSVLKVKILKMDSVYNDLVALVVNEVYPIKLKVMVFSDFKDNDTNFHPQHFYKDSF